jgi:hypothetical protein
MPITDLHQFCAEHQDEIEDLIEAFSDYQPGAGISVPHVMRWLGQFNAQHRLLALKLAKTVKYYGSNSVNRQLRALGQTVSQAVKDQNIPENSVFYLAGGRAGESGQDMLRRYRNVNDLRNRARQFVELLELPACLFQSDTPMVVFLDDFVGTGKQMCNYWQQVVYEYVPEYLPIYLGVVAAFADGIQRIEDNCPLTVLSVHTLTKRNQLLSAGNEVFSRSQKRILRGYCEQWANHPYGFGEIAALVSFFHGTPNNAPSVIRGSKHQRPNRGLLPGWSDLA